MGKSDGGLIPWSRADRVLEEMKAWKHRGNSLRNCPEFVILLDAFQ